MKADNVIVIGGIKRLTYQDLFIYNFQLNFDILNKMHTVKEDQNVLDVS